MGKHHCLAMPEAVRGRNKTKELWTEIILPQAILR